MTFPTYEKWGEKVAEQVIDVYLINGRTIREWIEILSDELTMLDKIREEIQEELKQDNHSFYRAALEDVIKTIDSYREGANE